MILINTLEKIINFHLSRQAKVTVSEQEKNMFRLMGIYQGQSHALISYASIAEQINWKHWEEEVFA